MDIFNLFLIGSGTVYLGAILWLLVGLHRTFQQNRDWRPAVSIIVAARNEAGSIGACLEALKEQNYEGGVEIVVVDDRSRDGTGEQVLQRASAAVKLVRAEDELRFKCPKKSALAQGIDASSGELLLFTDADCIPPPNWVSSTVEMFADDVGLVAGYALHQSGYTWRQHLLALDNVGVGALSAGSMGMGHPLACTGRNLAYRRSLYDEVDGFAAIGHLIGGDDVYFMRLIGECTRWRVVYNSESRAAVSCEPAPRHWGQIVQQKLRHAAKAGHYKGGALGLAVAVYLFHLMLALGPVYIVFWEGWSTPLLGVLLLRFVVDFSLLWSFVGQGQERKLLIYVPFLELCYIPYVLLFTVLGRLGRFSWKP